MVMGYLLPDYLREEQMNTELFICFKLFVYGGLTQEDSYVDVPRDTPYTLIDKRF